MVKSLSISRRAVARASVIALGAAVIVPAGLATAPAWAARALVAPTQITGVVQDAAAQSVAGACVYPFMSGDFQGLAGGSGTNMVLLLPGSCTDADGNFSVLTPPAIHKSAGVVGLLVTSPNLSLTGTVWQLSKGTTITLDAASAVVNTTVSTNSGGTAAPVPNALAEVYDLTTQQILGVGLSDAAGNATIPVTAVANPMDSVQLAGGAPMGLATPADLIGQSQLPAPMAGSSINAPALTIPDFTTISGQVTQDGSAPLAWQVVSALCQAACTASAVGLTDAQGNYALAVPVGAQVVVSAGTQHTVVNATTPTVSMPNIQAIPAGRALSNAGGPPTTWVSAGGITLKPSVTWSWSGGSLESAPDVWQVSTSTATWRSAPTAYAGLTNHLDQSLTAKLAYGATVCRKVVTVAVDAAVNSSTVDGGTTSCVTLPLDDRALKASSKWQKLKVAKAFGGTVSASTKAKSTLTLSGVNGNGLTVLWSRYPKGGSFTVSVNGKVIKTVSTKGAVAFERLTTIAKKGMKGAKVVIATKSDAPVVIDGLAVTH